MCHFRKQVFEFWCTNHFIYNTLFMLRPPLTFIFFENRNLNDNHEAAVNAYIYEVQAGTCSAEKGWNLEQSPGSHTSVQIKVQKPLKNSL